MTDIMKILKRVSQTERNDGLTKGLLIMLKREERARVAPIN